jgi:GNAT superfamily N-acetyltransferase
MRKEAVTVFFLTMNNSSQLRPVRPPLANMSLRQVSLASPEFSRFLYTAVGGNWYWLDRLCWSYQHWLDWLSQAEVQTWVLYLADTPAGYFELQQQSNGDVLICYFGLLPQHTGRGLGGYLLTLAIEKAWAMPANRVKLNTCTLDHPSALSNYQARGFKIYQEITEQRVLPDAPLGPWPEPWPLA